MADIFKLIGNFQSFLKQNYGEAKAQVIFECIQGKINIFGDILAQGMILLPQCEAIALAAENQEDKPVNPINLVQQGSDDCIISDRVVKLSDVGSLQCKPGMPLYIFATEAIQFDADLNDGRHERSIYIIAPKWEVTKVKVLINLNGTRGKDPEPLVAPGFGANGGAGQPGGAAGNFFGLGLTITNSARLSIHAVGGQGGDGQNGGHGKANVTGTSPKIRQETLVHDFFSRDSCDLFIARADVNGYDLSPRGVYRLFGDDNGGNGGNGGRQGEGGQKGEVLMLLKNNQPVDMIAKDGEDGRFGLGGAAGLGSVYGNDLYFTCSMLTTNFGIGEKSYKITEINQVQGGKAKDGLDGSDDYFNPWLPRLDGPRPPALIDVIAKYKAFCDSSTYPCSGEFLHYLDHSRVRRSIEAYEHMPDTNARGPLALDLAPLLLVLGVVLCKIWKTIHSSNSKKNHQSN